MEIFYFELMILFSFIIFSNQRYLNTIPENLSSNIIEDIRDLLFILPEDKLITFNNSLINVTLYNTSDKYFSYNKMNINFENCLTILQKVYDLDPFFDYSKNDNNEIYKRCFFIIVKIEIDRKFIKANNSITGNNYNLEYSNINNNITKYPTNHIEYLIFNGKNGKLLNTSYCNDLNVKISHPIVNLNGINLNISKKLYEEYNIDVYRANDSFFNDICMNYTSDKKTDLTLMQRRNMYYQNASFCDSNCTYVEINYTSNTAICACEVKDGIMNDELLFKDGEEYQHNKNFTYENVFSVINYRIFTCYKQVFDLKRLLINAGNYTSIAIIIVYTLCIIHFCRNRKRNVMFFFQKIKLKFNKDKDKEEEKNEKENNNNDISEGNRKNKFNKNKSININGIIITDISNPNKKRKIKLTTYDNINDNNNTIMKSDDNTVKDIKNLVHNYGDIKIDTGDELLDNKEQDRNWEEDIISIKKKYSKNTNHRRKEIKLTSGLSSTAFSSKKNYSIKTNNKKLEKSNTSFLFTKTNNNIDNYNYNNLFPSSNCSVEIPISNIIPSFLKSNNIFISSISPEKNLKELQNNFILKKCKTKCCNAIYNNYINKNDKISEKENDNNNNNCIDIEKDDINKNIYTLRRTQTILKRKTKDKKNKKNKNIAFNGNIKKYSNRNNLFGEFDDMKFEIAILIDNRNFCEKFLCEVKENCIIIILFFRDDFMFKQIKLSLFILSCTLDYFFNAFFFSDILFQKHYEEEKLISILIDYPKELFASLASQFIVKLIELLMEDKALTLFLRRIAFQKKNYLKGVNYLLKKYEKKFYIYISIGYFILGLTWYYSSAFCTVYQNSQMSLLYDTLQSLILNLILPFPISFLSVSFRHLAIKKLNKFLFFISNIFRIFT